MRHPYPGFGAQSLDWSFALHEELNSLNGYETFKLYMN